MNMNLYHKLVMLKMHHHHLVQMMISVLTLLFGEQELSFVATFHLIKLGLEFVCKNR